MNIYDLMASCERTSASAISTFDDAQLTRVQLVQLRDCIDDYLFKSMPIESLTTIRERLAAERDQRSQDDGISRPQRPQ